MCKLVSVLIFTFSALIYHASAVSVAPHNTVANDFEAGSTYPWFDNSPSDVHWLVEDYDSPLELTQAPRPNSGSKYLRAYRGTSGTDFGLAVLSSPYFTALPGDKLVLNFWIRSEHTGGNSLEVYYYRNGVEERILNLGIFSSPSNFEWRSASAVIPISEPTDLRLIIYGYCSGTLQDAIAIDDIIISRSSNGTTAPTTETTTTDSSDATTTTTTTATESTREVSTSETTTTSRETTTIYRTTRPTTTTATTLPPGNCSYILTEPSGQIKSPNYPDNYYSNASCTWLVKLRQPYTKVKFDFIAFTTEYCCDRLKIYDGETETSPVLLQHQGTSLPSPPSVTSSVPDVLVKFTSDFSIDKPGFWLEYSGVF